MLQPPKLKLTPVQRKTLEAACNALVPSIEAQQGQNPQFWRTRATDHQVPDKILEVIAGQNPGDQKAFVQLINLLNNSLALGLTSGHARKFTRLSPEKQQRVLSKWGKSRVGKLRQAFHTLKNLTCFIHYGSSPANGNQAWRAMDYPGPLGLDAGPRPKLEVLVPTDEQVFTCDTVVIGSGAGGGMAAGMLAEAGEDVIVVEKGPYLTGAHLTMQEAEMIGLSYDRMGALSSKDGALTVFAGSCLGGGTTINWTGSFPTPDYVLEEWAQEHGLGFANSTGYAKGMQAVMDSLSVNSDNSSHNPQNDALWRGSKSLGQQVEVIQRNVDGCSKNGGKHCGYCGLGCREGHKRGTLRTWLERAAAKGARILAETEVKKILSQNGTVTGLEAVYQKPGEQARNIQVRAKRVIVAAGAIQTPALLLRSGLNNPGLGKHLYFHPTFGVLGEYNDPVRPWYGVMMSAVNKAGMRSDGNYGHWIETPPVHPGMAAAGMPWHTPKQHKADMLKMSRTATFVVLTRDKFGGHVNTDKFGNAVVHYRLHPYDRQNMVRGIQEAARIHIAAGAKEVMIPHDKRLTYDTYRSKITPEQFVKSIPGLGWRHNRHNLYTAHQMGTCALGSDPNRHPCTPEGQFRGVKGLYIADGSGLPSAAGVNPMISIMGLAHHTIKNIIG